MRNAVLSVLLVITLVSVVLLGATQMNEPAEATTPVAAAAPLADDGLGLCLPPVVCVTVSVPVPVEVGVTATVTRLLPGPRVTVSLPRVTQIVTLPPVVRTILVPGEGVTRTVTIPVQQPGGTRTITAPGLPGATTTATVVVDRRIIQNGTAPPVTQEVRRTVSAAPVTQTASAGQTVTTRATVTPSKEVVRIPGTTKTVTRFQAVGLSLLGLLALMGLGLFLLWLGFVLGYKSSERENTNFLKALRDSVRRKPGKHELGS